jgi:hypothetical protein
MSSIREFVTKKLEPMILKDAKEIRIFNEADLQMRTAHHILRKFIADDTNCILRNQPSMRVGRGRGTISVKPDILICDGKGPLAAFELKCHLDGADQKIPSIMSGIAADIDVLRRLSQRFAVEYVFSIVLLNIADPNAFEELERNFTRAREPWMSHQFRLHLIDFRRTIRSFDEWEKRWQEAKGLASAHSIVRPKPSGLLNLIGLR